MNYKFLVERQMQKIKAGDRKFREEHKSRKSQMRSFLESADTLEQNLKPMMDNKKKMKKVLTKHLNNNTTSELLKLSKSNSTLASLPAS
mmetsp:Transcript_28651/g.35497  ORF Transcript_28651/g.35497 Transcript_28651/m.35497 type:complete len:89 (+) Transcript_28651:80-346(+)